MSNYSDTSTRYSVNRGGGGSSDDDDKSDDDYSYEKKKYEGSQPTSTSVKGDLSVAALYVGKNTSRDKRGFAIGLSTVLILVTFVCLLENSIKTAPVIFMRLAENAVGEYDLVLSPLAYNTSVDSRYFTACPSDDWMSGYEVNDSNSTEEEDEGMKGLNRLGLGTIINSMFLNWSKYDGLLKNCDAVNHSVPRWMMLGNFEPLEQNASAKETNASVIIIVANHSLEHSIGFGREFYVEKLGDREAAVSRTLLSRLGVRNNTGDKFFLSVNFLSLMSLSSGNTNESNGRALFNLVFDSLGIPRVMNFSFALPLSDEMLDYLRGNSSITVDMNLTQLLEYYKQLAEYAEEYNILLPDMDERTLEFLLLVYGIDVTNSSYSLPDLFPGLQNITYDEDNRAQVNIYIDFYEQFGESFDEIGDALVLNETFTVTDSIDDPGGKYPNTLGNVAVIDADALEPYIKEWLKNLGQPVRNMFGNLSDTLETGINILDVVKNMVSGLDDLIDNLKSVDDMMKDVSNSTYTWGSHFKMREYAMTSIAQLKDREAAYMLGVDELDSYMLKISNELSDYIGFNESVSFTTPVADSIHTYEFFRLFIDQIFLFILIVMLFLGACLVFSLLLSDVESKTYEYGMLRALGMKQYVLAELLSIQSFIFSAPGIVFGILLGWAFFVPIAYYISTYTMLVPDLSLKVVAWVLALCMGFFMPIIANVVPIKRALSNTLRDALDIYHKAVQGVSVTVKRLQDVGVSRTVLILAILIVGLGMLCYYLIPLSFVNSDMNMFFTIFILVLILFLFGLSMLATIIQPYFEKLLVYIIVWGKGRTATRSLVKKNLSGHHSRNSKTALMLTTSLAFIIFAGSVFSLLGSSLKDFSRLSYAADLLVMSSSINAPLEEDNLRTLLDHEMSRENAIVKSYTFVTYSLTSYKFIRSSQISNLGDYPRRNVVVSAVEQNFINSSFNDFYRTSEIVKQEFDYVKTPKGDPDVVDSLYRHAGQQLLPIEKDNISIPEPPFSEFYASEEYREMIREKYTSYYDVLISESLRDGASLDTDTPLIMRMTYLQQNSTDYKALFFMCKPRAMLESLEGFSFSKYKSMEFSSPMLMSMDSFQNLLEIALEKSNMTNIDLPEKPVKARLLVTLTDDVSDSEREQLINEIHVFVNSDLIFVQDTKDLMKTMDQTLSMLNIFFLVVSIIAGLLCFFVLWLSFTANVNENSWEFAVLRSVGITAMRVISLYVYEAFSIVLSSVILGTAIGLLVAIMMTGQFGMFTQLPFIFVFPSELFFPILAMCIIIAFIGSFVPALVIRRKPISSVLKGM